MAAKKKKTKKKGERDSPPAESRAAEALTVAWTVTITTLLFCNLATIAAHYFVKVTPDAKKLLVLREMLLFSCAIVGGLSLTMLPFVRRYRRIPPPQGLVVFSVCLAIAPILVVVLRAIR